jgi:hypothetical protein
MVVPKTGEKHQEAVMIPHPRNVQIVTNLRRDELLTIVEREHRATRAGAPTPQRRSPVVFVLALVALAFGLRS